MPLFVLDSSIAFDLERGGMLEAAFQLDGAFITPDLLYLKELQDGPGPYMRGLGMQVVELLASEVETAQQLAKANKRVSTPDCWAMVTAKRPNHRLLTGDALLRAMAVQHDVECSGLLWVFDKIHDSKIVDPTALIEGLNKVCRHARCRLPQGDVQARLEKWHQADRKLQSHLKAKR